MDSRELPYISPTVDYQEILPIHQKRTIAFFNHFVANTVSFLNVFAKSCESRLMDLEHKLQKVEASLLILESQIASVPSLKKVEELEPNTNNDTEEVLNLPDVNVQEQEVEVIRTNSPPGGNKVSEDPRYARFFKMIQFGVPFAAVKLKMKTEGVDPNILDNPNELVPERPTTEL